MMCLQAGGFRQAAPEEIHDIFSQFFQGSNLGDLFEAQRRQQRMRGADLQTQVRLTLREAARGVNKAIEIPGRNIHGRKESRTVQVHIPPGASDCVLLSSQPRTVILVCAYIV